MGEITHAYHLYIQQLYYITNNDEHVGRIPFFFFFVGGDIFNSIKIINIKHWFGQRFKYTTYRLIHGSILNLKETKIFTKLK